MYLLCACFNEHRKTCTFQVRTVMTESVDKALDRSMKLDDLAEKSGEVHVQAMN